MSRATTIEAVLAACTEHIERGGTRMDLQTRIEQQMSIMKPGLDHDTAQIILVSAQRFVEAANELRAQVREVDH